MASQTLNSSAGPFRFGGNFELVELGDLCAGESAAADDSVNDEFDPEDGDCNNDGVDEGRAPEARREKGDCCLDGSCYESDGYGDEPDLAICRVMVVFHLSRE